MLYNILNDHLNENSIAQLNKDFTRITSHQQPSCLDKIYTNKPNKFSNIRTCTNIDSDHKYVIARYMTREPAYHPKFVIKRDFKKLTKFNINDYINRSDILNEIFTSNDPDFISECLQIELNSIYNVLAPATYHQFKQNYIPYYTPKIIDDIRYCNNLLTKAIQTHDSENWRNYRTNRSILNKNIKKVKREYIKNNLTRGKNKWKTVKKFNNQEKSVPPNSIIQNGKIHTSPRDIANIANNYFISKIEGLRRTFFDDIVTPMEIVRALCPRVEDNFDIPLITVGQTLDLLLKTKSSNSTGYDDLNSKFMKKCAHKIAPHLTHLINTILCTKKIPKIYKVSRILPMSKPLMDRNDIANFRPLNNL